MIYSVVHRTDTANEHRVHYESASHGGYYDRNKHFCGS